MSNTRAQVMHWSSPIYIIGVLLSIWMPRLERIILYGLFIGSTLSHWHYGTRVVQQMCVHFNRTCFKVTPRITKNQNNVTNSTKNNVN